MRYLFIISLSFLFHSSFAQVVSLNVRLDSLLYAKRDKPFNGIILVSSHGAVDYFVKKGFSNLEQQTDLTLNDQFVIGSISKQFTAVLVLQQVDKGKLELYVPIRKYLPTLSQSWADTVTVHHLLTHTHGIVERDQPALFKAGTQYTYSQLGYELLSQIIEQTSGKSFALLSADLFRKCKMHHTFHPSLLPHDNRLVKGYTEQWDGALQFDSLSLDNYPAAGAFISTAHDVYLWNQQLHQGKLLKKETYRAMITSQAKAVRQHPIFGTTLYGYGLTVKQLDHSMRLGQTGYAPGFISMNFYHPETQTSIIVLENVVYDSNELKQAFYYPLQVLKIVEDHR